MHVVSIKMYLNKNLWSHNLDKLRFLKQSGFKAGVNDHDLKHCESITMIGVRSRSGHSSSGSLAQRSRLPELTPPWYLITIYCRLGKHSKDPTLYVMPLSKQHLLQMIASESVNTATEETSGASSSSSASTTPSMQVKRKHFELTWLLFT